MAGERFYLRLFLTVVYGPQSFEYLRTVDDVVYDTFREAAVAIGLTHDDREWVETFTEAAMFSSGNALQRLLVTVLVHADLANAVDI